MRASDAPKKKAVHKTEEDTEREIMGRCNGGGGRRNGGGGFQEGQNKGTKSGKTGHGKNSGHDASQQSQRQERRFDKWGQPLNYGMR